MLLRPQRSTRTDTLFPYPTLFRSAQTIIALAAPAQSRRPQVLDRAGRRHDALAAPQIGRPDAGPVAVMEQDGGAVDDRVPGQSREPPLEDRKSTRLNSSH